MDNPIDRLGDEVYTFVFGGRTFTVTPGDDLPIDENMISEEFANQAALYAYIAVLTAKADAALKQAKALLDEVEAETDTKVRDRFELEGRKSTEKMIASHVTTNPDVKAQKRMLLQAEADYSLLRALEAAFQMRADMLIRIGAHERAEMSMTGLSIPKPEKPKRPAKNPEDAMKAALQNSRNKADS